MISVVDLLSTRLQLCRGKGFVKGWGGSWALPGVVDVGVQVGFEGEGG